MDKIDQWKRAAKEQWNATPCGSTEVSDEKGSLAFFDAVRHSRYFVTDSWMLEKIPFASGKDKKVLEIGFGMGTDLLNWCERGAEVHGIDLSQEHLRLASLNFQLHHRFANLQLADGENIPFPANYFDIVYSNGVLHHTPDTARCIAEAYRVLKPNGRLIFSVYRTFSAFHCISVLLVNGLWKGNLRKLGYEGLLSTIEKGANGINIKPLVKTYRKSQLKRMLADFSKVEFKVAHFKKEHLANFAQLCPQYLEPVLEKWLGWYLIAYAKK